MGKDELLAAGDGEERDSTAEDGDSDSIFGAAYEGVTYLDSTDDGVEGQIFEEEGGNADELIHESKRLGEQP